MALARGSQLEMKLNSVSIVVIRYLLEKHSIRVNRVGTYAVVSFDMYLVPTTRAEQNKEARLEQKCESSRFFKLASAKELVDSSKLDVAFSPGLFTFSNALILLGLAGNRK